MEVAKALQLDARIIIFDEPTTSLTPRETARLFELIGRLTAAARRSSTSRTSSATCRRWPRTWRFCATAQLVASGPVADFPVERMITRMLGRSIEQLFPTRTPSVRPEGLLEARGVTVEGLLHGIDLTVNAGEVVGLFGLMGSGRTALARTLFGLDPADQGEIRRGSRRMDK